MFQPLEVTEVRTIWIDSPGDDRLGFQDSSRVQIDRNPIGTGDFSEPGDGFKATLLGGMWPDDDELRLLVVGIVPGSPQAANLIDSLVSDKGDDIEDVAAEGWKILRSLVQIMPSWSGQQVRAMFVMPGLTRVRPETVKTAAVNSEPDRKLSFDMFRVQVDAMLIARGKPATDTWDQSNMLVLSNPHAKGVTPAEFVNSYMEKVNGGDQAFSKSPPA